MRPQTNLPNTNLYRVVDIGYEIVLYGGTSGRQLSSQLLRDAVLVLKPQQAQTRLAQQAGSLLSARYLQQNWEPQPRSSYNAAAGTLTIQTRNLGTWAAVVPQAALAQQPPQPTPTP